MVPQTGAQKLAELLRVERFGQKIDVRQSVHRFAKGLAIVPGEQDYGSMAFAAYDGCDFTALAQGHFMIENDGIHIVAGCLGQGSQPVANFDHDMAPLTQANPQGLTDVGIIVRY
jgi:hypothetical protein